jgi:hypothetical protein
MGLAPTRVKPVSPIFRISPAPCWPIAAALPWPFRRLSAQKVNALLFQPGRDEEGLHLPGSHRVTGCTPTDGNSLTQAQVTYRAEHFALARRDLLNIKKARLPSHSNTSVFNLTK